MDQSSGDVHAVRRHSKHHQHGSDASATPSGEKRTLPPPVAARPGKLPGGKSAAERERERERAQRVRQMMKAGVAVRQMAQNANMAQNAAAGLPGMTNGVIVSTANGQYQMANNGVVLPSPYAQQQSSHHQQGFLVQNLGPEMAQPQQYPHQVGNGSAGQAVPNGGLMPGSSTSMQQSVVVSSASSQPATAGKTSLKHSGAGQAFLARWVFRRESFQELQYRTICLPLQSVG